MLYGANYGGYFNTNWNTNYGSNFDPYLNPYLNSNLNPNFDPNFNPNLNPNLNSNLTPTLGTDFTIYGGNSANNLGGNFNNENSPMSSTANSADYAADYSKNYYANQLPQDYRLSTAMPPSFDAPQIEGNTPTEANEPEQHFTNLYWMLPSPGGVLSTCFAHENPANDYLIQHRGEALSIALFNIRNIAADTPAPANNSQPDQ
jgi:hypothetical protein